MTGLANRSESGPSDVTAAPGPEIHRSPYPDGPRWWLLVPVFLVLAVAMTFPSLGKLTTHTAGNSGDALLVMWMLGWVQHALPHGWGAVWDTSMYHPARDTLAYSDSMISAAIAQWPFRAVFGQVLGFNLYLIATQTAALWFSYRLVLLLTRSWPAAFVGALMFGFSQPLLSHLGHSQLLMNAFLVPLTLLLLIRYLDGFRMRFGVGVGLALGVLITGSTYYALMTAVGVGVVVLGYLVWFRPRHLWIALRGLAVGAAITAAIALPVAPHYMSLQDDPHFRRGFEPGAAAHVGDFLSVDGANYFVDELPVLDVASATRGVENHLYPGAFAVAFALVGAVVVLRALRRGSADDGDGDGDDDGPGATEPVPFGGATIDGPRSPARGSRWTSRMTILLCLGGIAAVVLAFGDQVQVFGQTVWMPMKVFRKVVPGFSGIRALSRFVVLGQLALALLAAFGIRALLVRCTKPVATIVFVVLCALVLVESAQRVPLVDVPDGRVAEAVGRFLDDRPDGVVAELPIHGTQDGPVWAYSESPRVLVSLIDANDRINGYSGFTPPGFDELVPVYNAFPSPESLAALDDADVRYVVLRTKVIGDQFPVFDDLLSQDGVGRFTPATARERIAAIPPDRVKQVTRVPGAYVVELTRPSR